MRTSYRTLRLFLLLAVLGAAQCLPAAVSAASVMETMRAKLAEAKNIEVLFTLRNGSKPVQGSAYMSGARFFFETPQLSVWYDGRTQWTQMHSTGEVNITEPTVEELTATNPFAILSNYASLYKARRLSDNAGCHRVELTPSAGNSGISHIIISASIKTGFPTAVEVSLSDGRTISLKVDSIKAVPARPQTVFTYDRKKFPATDIIDLR